MNSRGLAAVMGALSLALALLAFSTTATWAALGIGWAALSFALVAVAYLGYGRHVFAKDAATGRIPWHRKMMLWPYFLLTWGTWHASRWLGKENACDRLSADFCIGRRLLPGEYPDGIRTIVDLTWEFDAPPVPSGIAYYSHPLLDAAALAPEHLRNLARTLASLDRPLYLHCAQGHGRTAMVAAALLMALGVVDSPDLALERVRSVRPGARPNAAQTRAVLAAITARAAQGRSTT